MPRLVHTTRSMLPIMIGGLLTAAMLAACDPGATGTGSAAGTTTESAAPAGPDGTSSAPAQPGTAQPGTAQPGTMASASAVAQPVSARTSPVAQHAAPGGAAVKGRRCQTRDLRISAMEKFGGAGAGHYTEIIQFTNVSTSACVLNGFPSVRFAVTSSGPEVNDPAAQDKSQGSPSPVLLRPNDMANAELYLVRAGNYGDSCKPVKAAGLMVYPPNETVGTFAAIADEVCSVHGLAVPTVGPIKPGAKS